MQWTCWASTAEPTCEQLTAAVGRAFRFVLPEMTLYVVFGVFFRQHCEMHFVVARRSPSLIPSCAVVLCIHSHAYTSVDTHRIYAYTPSGLVRRLLPLGGFYLCCASLSLCLGVALLGRIAHHHWRDTCALVCLDQSDVGPLSCCLVRWELPFFPPKYGHPGHRKCLFLTPEMMPDSLQT